MVKQKHLITISLTAWSRCDGIPILERRKILAPAGVNTGSNAPSALD
jgi:hypothetical protein